MCLFVCLLGCYVFLLFVCLFVFSSLDREPISPCGVVPAETDVRIVHGTCLSNGIPFRQTQFNIVYGLEPNPALLKGKLLCSYGLILIAMFRIISCERYGIHARRISDCRRRWVGSGVSSQSQVSPWCHSLRTAAKFHCRCRTTTITATTTTTFKRSKADQERSLLRLPVFLVMLASFSAGGWYTQTVGGWIVSLNCTVFAWIEHKRSAFVQVVITSHQVVYVAIVSPTIYFSLKEMVHRSLFSFVIFFIT